MRPAPKLERMVRDNRRRLSDCYDSLGRYKGPEPSSMPLVFGVVLVCGMCLLAKVWL